MSINRRDFFKASVTTLTATVFARLLPIKPIILDQWRGAFWRKVLTAQEMAALHAGIHPLFVAPEFLVRYWPFESVARKWLG